MKKWMLAVTAWGVFQLGAVPSQAAEPTALQVVGQLVGGGASIDGLAVPSGTTLLSGSVVSAGARPASVHLVNGQMVEVGGNSRALLRRGQGGEIRVSVQAGTLSFVEAGGAVSTLPADYEAIFAQRRAGEPVRSAGEGLVAVVAPAGGLSRAEAGQDRVPVNDASRIQPTSEILLQTALTRTDPKPQAYVQEVACAIESIRDNVVTLNEDLEFTYEPDDRVIQASRVPASQVRTKLKRPASRGDDLLQVEDSKKVHPLERIVLRSPDQRLREVACVRWTEEDLSQDADATEVRSVVKLRADLENAFPTGSEVLQGKRFETERKVTELSQGVRRNQRRLVVRDGAAVDPLQQVLIRSTDGRLMEAYCVYSVQDNVVVLAEDLDHDYPEYSEIIQGRSSQELIAQGVALQRTANCCCCCEVGILAGGIPWWRTPLPYVPIVPPVIVCSTLGCFGGPPPGTSVPPPASPTAP